jgi:APA family basic amino acid/polyamine antiporter
VLVTIGLVASKIAGPGVALSFIFAGFASFLSALCYSEFATRIPVSGSAYTYAYASFGEVFAWL